MNRCEAPDADQADSRRSPVASRTANAPIDANGNLSSDGTRTFERDARHQLLAVTAGTHRSDFSYDGLQRRVRQVEKENSVVQSDRRVLWCETAICEERAADGMTVTRRAFGLGEQITGQAHYFTTDHLGSVREVTDTAGTLLARYAFDPWGRRTVIAGADVTTVGFTGHQFLVPAAVVLAPNRELDASLSRWLSADPAGPVDGPNLYVYVGNNPVGWFDPTGSWKARTGPRPPGGSTIVCDGRGGITVDIQEVDIQEDPETERCAGACLVVHEGSHQRDVSANDPFVCRGKPAGLAVMVPA